MWVYLRCARASDTCNKNMKIIRLGLFWKSIFDLNLTLFGLLRLADRPHQFDRRGECCLDAWTNFVIAISSLCKTFRVFWLKPKVAQVQMHPILLHLAATSRRHELWSQEIWAQLKKVLCKTRFKLKFVKGRRSLTTAAKLQIWPDLKTRCTKKMQKWKFATWKLPKAPIDGATICSWESVWSLNNCIKFSSLVTFNPPQQEVHSEKKSEIWLLIFSSRCRRKKCEILELLQVSRCSN